MLRFSRRASGGVERCHRWFISWRLLSISRCCTSSSRWNAYSENGNSIGSCSVLDVQFLLLLRWPGHCWCCLHSICSAGRFSSTSLSTGWTMRWESHSFSLQITISWPCSPIGIMSGRSMRRTIQQCELIEFEVDFSLCFLDCTMLYLFVGNCHRQSFSWLFTHSIGLKFRWSVSYRLCRLAVGRLSRRCCCWQSMLLRDYLCRSSSYHTRASWNAVNRYQISRFSPNKARQIPMWTWACPETSHQKIQPIGIISSLTQGSPSRRAVERKMRIFTRSSQDRSRLTLIPIRQSHESARFLQFHSSHVMAVSTVFSDVIRWRI